MPRTRWRRPMRRTGIAGPRRPRRKPPAARRAHRGQGRLAVKNQPLNCGSKILGKFISPYDATVVEKLKAAGAIVFGRLNMDEFAMGSSTENSAFGVTRNPWDTTRIPGGSSGGSAAAVAADECIAALGSDTGGSIRQPAALCGCVGLKPTYGRVSRYGLVAFAVVARPNRPFTKDVRDAATMLGVMSGHDPRDSTSVPQPVPDYAAALTGDIKGFEARPAEGIHDRRAGPGSESRRGRRRETI
jgi:aspartyl-tRNA(Asn)/glutamyl-tRNA(Gln) amidotransferase subunit A